MTRQSELPRPSIPDPTHPTPTPPLVGSPSRNANSGTAPVLKKRRTASTDQATGTRKTKAKPEAKPPLRTTARTRSAKVDHVPETLGVKRKASNEDIASDDSGSETDDDDDEQYERRMRARIEEEERREGMQKVLEKTIAGLVDTKTSINLSAVRKSGLPGPMTLHRPAKDDTLNLERTFLHGVEIYWRPLDDRGTTITLLRRHPTLDPLRDVDTPPEPGKRTTGLRTVDLRIRGYQGVMNIYRRASHTGPHVYEIIPVVCEFTRGKFGKTGRTVAELRKVHAAYLDSDCRKVYNLTGNVVGYFQVEDEGPDDVRYCLVMSREVPSSAHISSRRDFLVTYFPKSPPAFLSR